MKIAKLPDNLQGKWIWTERKHHHATQHVLLRKEFTLDEIPGTAEIWLASQAKYILFVNGRFYSAGSATSGKCNICHQAGHHAPHASRKNDLAIHAFSDQTPCVAHKPDAPAIWLQLTCDGNVHVVTDESWLCLNAECYQESGQGFTTTPHRDSRPQGLPAPLAGVSTNSLITQSPLSWPPKTAIPITESAVIESEPDFNRVDIAFLRTRCQRHLQLRNKSLISFADCFKGRFQTDSMPRKHSSTAHENGAANRTLHLRRALQDLRQQPTRQRTGSPTFGKNYQTHTLSEDSHRGTRTSGTQITLRKGWNRILVLQHCSN